MNKEYLIIKSSMTTIQKFIYLCCFPYFGETINIDNKEYLIKNIKLSKTTIIIDFSDNNYIEIEENNIN